MNHGTIEGSQPQQSKTTAMVTWLLTIPFGVIPGLVVYATRGNDAYARGQAREALNWAITMLLAYAAAFLLLSVFHSTLFRAAPVLAVLVLVPANLVFCIRGAVAAAAGRSYRTPFAIRLLG